MKKLFRSNSDIGSHEKTISSILCNGLEVLIKDLTNHGSFVGPRTIVFISILQQGERLGRNRRTTTCSIIECKEKERNLAKLHLESYNRAARKTRLNLAS